MKSIKTVFKEVKQKLENMYEKYGNKPPLWRVSQYKFMIDYLETEIKGEKHDETF